MARRLASQAGPRRLLAAASQPGAVAGWPLVIPVVVAALLLPLAQATPVGAGIARPARPVLPLTTSARVSAGSPAIGALFNTSPSGALAGHFCSGSVVDSPAGDLVITAAHCLAQRTAGQIVFVPGYLAGRTPYGSWTVTRVITLPAWDSSANPDDDVAFLQVSRPGSGVPIQQVTGGEQLGIGAPPAQVVDVTGYPAGQGRPVTCRNRTRLFSPTQLEFRCAGFPTGTSGGPMLADVNPATGLGTVIGVIGGYHQGGLTAAVSYAARLGSAIAALYRQATRRA